MPVWKFTPVETGDIAVLEDVSLDLSAYYQSLENLATYLRAHDGIELEDLLARLETYCQSLEDIGSELSTKYQSLENLAITLESAGWAIEGTRMLLHAAGLVFADLRTDLAALGDAREDMAAYFRAAGYARHDLTTYLSAVIPLILSDLGVSFESTDGLALSSLGICLAAVKRAPSFRSVIAQRVSSVIQEV